MSVQFLFIEQLKPAEILLCDLFFVPLNVTRSEHRYVPLCLGNRVESCQIYCVFGEDFSDRNDRMHAIKEMPLRATYQIEAQTTAIVLQLV